MNYRCVSADPRAVLQTALSGEPRIVLDAELGSQRWFPVSSADASSSSPHASDRDTVREAEQGVSCPPGRILF